MITLDEAKRALRRVSLDDEQKARSQYVYDEASRFLEILWCTAKPSPELTLAIRSFQEALLWHSKAIANETSK